MRTNQSGSDVLQYILSDHIGSTSTIVNASGDYVARTGYMPWGGERFSTADIPTGQRLEDDLGIYYYNARWYDPSIGRFLQADTIVPDPGNPLAYDRYAHVLNNPLRYTDPSGHLTEEQIEEWSGLKKDDLSADIWEMLLALRFGDTLHGYNSSGNLTTYGQARLDDSGHLTFGNTSLHNLQSHEGWLLSRTIGDNSYIAYQSGGYPYPDDFGGNSLYNLDNGCDTTVGFSSGLKDVFEDAAIGYLIGKSVETMLPILPPGKTELITTVAGAVHGVVKSAIQYVTPGGRYGDQILTYYYQDESNDIWQQQVIISNDLIVSYSVTPHNNPWYVSLLED